ncbi:hypothetical protein GQ44DRAFT_705590 [Phaeosphaeriaceae sp. PMI808]|nr:hypothetical protein GQ44DRAFT_705590 [Phaeosphaeriaceae sp. PMI808]
MRLKRHVSLLESTLRHVASRPLLPASASLCARHRYSSTYPERIAVLGGGVAGLSSAYFVAKEFPNSKITVFEAGKETGGWIKSRKVEVPGGEIIFESGPRTLRRSSTTTHLIQELDLADALTFTKTTDDAARNRYIYYPDRLNRLPMEIPDLSTVFSLWRSGLLKGLSRVAFEPTVRPRDPQMSDETVGSFISRRMDKAIANNFISAVCHGIYAGDIWKLSVKSILPLAWQLEGRYGNTVAGYVRMQNEVEGSAPRTMMHPYDIKMAKARQQNLDLDPRLCDKMMESSTFTFKNGMQQLDQALQDGLRKKGNVEVKLNSPVLSTKLIQGDSLKVAVTTGTEPNPQTENFDLVISSLRNKSLTPYVTVMTVNLYYTDPSLLPVQGFGYLIPQSVPFVQNPERALGVLFDSIATSGQDTVSGTKITVMLGGHWWDDWDTYPTESEGLSMAQAIVQRHLGIEATPTASHVNLSKDCIPQYTLGYRDRLREYADELKKEYRGRLRVVGAQFNGVGVNDCINAARNLAWHVSGEGWKSESVGLDRAEKAQWRTVDMAVMTYQYNQES